MSTDCKFEATRKDNLRQHCFKIHKLVPGAQLTNAENTKELETSKHRVVPEEAVWPKPANRSHGDRHSWTSKLFLQAATTGNLAVVVASLEDGIDVNLRADDGSSALHCAARTGHIDVVEVLLQANSDIGVKNLKERSPLHEALLSQSLEIVKLLLRGGALLNTSDITIDCLARSGDPEIFKTCLQSLTETPSETTIYNTLLAASRHGQVRLVEALLPLLETFCTGVNDVGRPTVLAEWQTFLGNVNLPKSQPASRLTRFTPLHVAAANGHLPIVRFFVDHGVDINQAFKTITPLHIAAGRGHVSIVEYIISLPGTEVDGACTCRSITPLNHAIVRGRTDVVRALLSHAKVNVQSTDSHGRTPLHIAAMSGHVELTELLLQLRHVDTRLRDHDGHTPLELGTYRCHWEVVHALLNQDELDLVPERSDHPRQPEFTSPAEVVKRLLSHPDFHDVNASDDSKDSEGCILNATIRSGSADCVQIVLSYESIDVNLESGSHRSTPLMVASQLGSVEIVKLLLMHKDIDISKQAGYPETRSALSIARNNGHSDIVEILLQHGATDHDTTPTLKFGGHLDNLNRSRSANSPLEELLGDTIESLPYLFPNEYMDQAIEHTSSNIEVTGEREATPKAMISGGRNKD
jgi:ankyrin repeat protein